MPYDSRPLRRLVDTYGGGHSVDKLERDARERDNIPIGTLSNFFKPGAAGRSQMATSAVRARWPIVLRYRKHNRPDGELLTSDEAERAFREAFGRDLPTVGADSADPTVLAIHNAVGELDPVHRELVRELVVAVITWADRQAQRDIPIRLPGSDSPVTGAGS